MASEPVPYVNAYGNITKALERIKTASTPDRFTQDFLSTKLALKGGSARPVLPFLKRTGFVGTDGAPTSRYKRFRNSASSGAAAAEALRAGYQALYEINEYAHELSDDELKGVVVQATGAAEGSSTVRAIVGSFKALKAFATFDDGADDYELANEEDEEDEQEGQQERCDLDAEGLPRGLRLGYTINLHLPATSDVAVFNAIFKSLRENLL